MTRCLEECGKQWRPKQEKLGWQKQKKEETKKEVGRKQEEQKKRKQQRRKMVKEWKIWNEEEEAARSEEETKKLVPKKFYQWIKVFGKKQLERMPMQKIWDHAINMKEGFMPRKKKVYLLSRGEREEMRKFIQEQLRKGYI